MIDDTLVNKFNVKKLVVPVTLLFIVKLVVKIGKT